MAIWGSAVPAAPTSVTAPTETAPSQSIQHSAPTTESIPGPSDHTLPDTRPDKLRRRLEATLQLSYKQDRVQDWARQRPTAWKRVLLISAGAIVVVGLVALATGNLVARRQNQGATVLHHAAIGSDTFQAGQTVASIQSAGGTSATDFNARSADPTPVLQQSDIEISESAQTPQYPTDRTDIATGTLSRPVLKSSPVSTSTEPPPPIRTKGTDVPLGRGVLRPVLKLPPVSTSSEPPLILGTQGIDVALGNGLLTSSGPAPPSAGIGGHLQPPKLVSSHSAVYPPFARSAGIEGVAVIDALVDATGKVTEMTVISGPSSLTPAAMDALRTWKYEPAQLNGQPIAMHVHVSINFSLQ